MADLTLQADGQRVLYLRKIDRDLWTAVQAKAVDQGITIKQAILKALETYATHG